MKKKISIIAAELSNNKDVLFVDTLCEEIDRLNKWVKSTGPLYMKIKKKILTTIEGVLQKNQLAIKEIK